MNGHNGDRQRRAAVCSPGPAGSALQFSWSAPVRLPAGRGAAEAYGFQGEARSIVVAELVAHGVARRGGEEAIRRLTRGAVSQALDQEL